MAEQGGDGPVIDAVVIGRNEGARLLACLESLRAQDVRRIVYVDSGSTDGSVAAARGIGAEVVELDPALPFTAARARNAGLARLEAGGLVQLIDGDCALQDGWLNRAAAFLNDRPNVALVCGRRKERAPQASVYNRLADDEWDTAIGEARACGGDALARLDALRAAGGFRDTLIAGEEPELCLRLRQAGWRIWRLDAGMTWHDAAMTRFGQWARRTRRAGHAFAEGAALHGAAPERHWVAETRRALLWGAALPLAALLATLAWPLGWVAWLVFPAQIARLAVRAGGGRWAWTRAAFLVIGKPFEAAGALEYTLRRLRGRQRGILEYK